MNRTGRGMPGIKSALSYYNRIMASLGPDPAKTAMPATSRHEGRPLMQREHLHCRYLEPLRTLRYAILIACSELVNRSSPTRLIGKIGFYSITISSNLASIEIMLQRYAGYALGRIKVSNRFLRLLSLSKSIIKFSPLTQINPIDISI